MCGNERIGEKEKSFISHIITSLWVLQKPKGDQVFLVRNPKRPNHKEFSECFRYHHMTVLIYSWYSFSEYSAQARWFIVMNYLVHSVMYTYYASKSIK